MTNSVVTSPEQAVEEKAEQIDRIGKSVIVGAVAGLSIGEALSSGVMVMAGPVAGALTLAAVNLYLLNRKSRKAGR